MMLGGPSPGQGGVWVAALRGAGKAGGVGLPPAPWTAVRGRARAEPEGLGVQVPSGFEKRRGAHGETWPAPPFRGCLNSPPPHRLAPWHRGPLASLLGQAWQRGRALGGAREGPPLLCFWISWSSFSLADGWGWGALTGCSPRPPSQPCPVTAFRGLSPQPSGRKLTGGAGSLGPQGH